MPRCCGSAGTCACKVESGRNITVTGIGSSQDPFVIAADVAFAVEDSATFNLILTGNGTLASPWTLSAQYADTASLDDLPDVDVAGVSTAKVLGYDPALGKWTPQPPATATPGGMTTDTSMDGDGSAGDPLMVRPDGARYIQVSGTGVGLTDDAINRMLRVFPDAPSRAAASPVPADFTLSMLVTNPGQVDYWTGTAWTPLTNGIGLDVKPGELLALSGSYANGPVVQYAAQLSVETAVDGAFEVIPTADLSTYAGVLTVHLQQIGTGIPWVAMLTTDTDRIVGKAYRGDDGTPYGGFTITGVVTALLY